MGGISVPMVNSFYFTGGSWDFVKLIVEWNSNKIVHLFIQIINKFLKDIDMVAEN